MFMEVFLDQPLLIINIHLIVFTGANLSSDAILERLKLEVFQKISI